MNSFIESCLREILLLIETKPGERQWPRLVLAVDSARGIQHTPDEVARDLQRLKSMLEQLLGATKPAAEPVNSTVVQKLVAAVKGGTPAPPAPERSTSPAPARPARTDKDRPA